MVGLDHLASIGVVHHEGAQSRVTLSEPMFYTKWIWLDVDLSEEGFEVTPAWVGAPAAVGLFGGDAFFDFSGSTPSFLDFNDTDAINSDGNLIESRVQADFLGPVTGLTMLKTGDGGAGFTLGGGCVALGVAKSVSEVVWDAVGQKYTVIYDVAIRNNLPSQDRINATLAAGQASGASSIVGSPSTIPVEALTATDPLDTTGFFDVEVVAVSATEGLVANPAYDGISDTNLLAPNQTLAADTVSTVTVEVDYYPDLTNGCADIAISNQVEVTGMASGVAVSDLSDSGTDPDPLAVNEEGTTGDDPTMVVFPALDPCGQVSVDKSTSTPWVGVVSPGDPFDVAYQIVVANTGLLDVSANPTDDVLAGYGAGASITNLSLVADGPCAGQENPAFGPGSPALLSGPVVLDAEPVGSCTFDIAFTVTPGSALSLPITYTNQAGVEATALTTDATGTQRLTNHTVTDSSTVDVVVDVAPEIADDASLDNPPGSTVSVGVLANDDPNVGSDGIQLIDPATGDFGYRVAVPGQGTWTLAAGEVMFVPEAGFFGDPTPIEYGLTRPGSPDVRASVTVTYLSSAAPDASSDNPVGSTVSVNPLANDVGSLVVSSLRLLDPDGSPVRRLNVPNEGLWRVGDDGVVTFVPMAGFRGDPTPVRYQVESSSGTPVQSTITVSYARAIIVPPTRPAVTPTPAPTPVPTPAPASSGPGAPVSDTAATVGTTAPPAAGPAPSTPQPDVSLAFTGPGTTEVAAATGVSMITLGLALVAVGARRRRLREFGPGGLSR